nr:hypothetical protein [Sagittula salina]
MVGTSEEADTGTPDGPPEASALVRDETAQPALPVPGAHEEPAAEGAGPEDSEQEGGVFAGDNVLERKIAALEALVRNRVAREDDVVAGDPAEDIDPVDIVKHAAFHSVREARENLEDHRAEPDGEGHEFESDDLGEEGVSGVGEVSEAGIHAVDPAVSESTEDDEPPLAYNEEPDAVLAELLQSVADATEAEAGETDRTVLPFGDTHSRAVDETAEAEKTAEAIDWEDVAEGNVRGADIAADPERVPAAAAPADSPVAAREDMPMIDEAMLREMVSDIVRQELQGVLGERITRNVRKLVRREIHRVMMTQDFD